MTRFPAKQVGAAWPTYRLIGFGDCFAEKADIAGPAESGPMLLRRHSRSTSLNGREVIEPVASKRNCRQQEGSHTWHVLRWAAMLIGVPFDVRS